MIHDAGADLLGSECLHVCAAEEEKCVNAFSNISKNLNDVSSCFVGLSLQNNSVVDKDQSCSCYLHAFYSPF